MPKNKSAFWKYFEEREGKKFIIYLQSYYIVGDPSKMTCLISGCGKEISRGKTGTVRGKLSSWGMKSHLQKTHEDIWKVVEDYFDLA